LQAEPIGTAMLPKFAPDPTPAEWLAVEDDVDDELPMLFFSFAES